MTGTNEEEGRKILSQNGITPGTSAPEAAAKIVALVGGSK
jgi:succinyl-CoA synthetase beta subunit